MENTGFKIGSESGWQKPPASKRNHYFKSRNSRSLCGGWRTDGYDLESDADQTEEEKIHNCAVCKRWLERERNKYSHQ